MSYSHFKENDSVALALVAITWLSLVVYIWMAVLNIAERDGLLTPALLTVCSVTSIIWWRKSMSADKRLQINLLSTSKEWAQGSIGVRIMLARV
jgi:hypothetical protein